MVHICFICKRPLRKIVLQENPKSKLMTDQILSLQFSEVPLGAITIDFVLWTVGIVLNFWNTGLKMAELIPMEFRTSQTCTKGCVHSYGQPRRPSVTTAIVMEFHRAAAYFSRTCYES